MPYSIAKLRQLDPDFANYSDDELAAAFSAAGFDVTPPEPRSALRAVGDAGVKLVAGIPKAVAGTVGLGTFVPGVDTVAGPVSDALNSVGQAIEGAALSDYQKRKDAELAQALAGQDSISGDLQAVGSYLWENPGQIVMQGLGSLPSMYGGGILGNAVRKLGAAAKAAPIANMSGATAAAIGEGLMSAGSTASDIYQKNPDDYMARLYAVPSGLAVAGISRIGGRIMGENDIDTMIANSMAKNAVGEPGLNLLKSLPKRVGMGLIGEGAEEAPQSAIERMALNLGTGQPVMQGVAGELLFGGAVGAGMGGVAGIKRPLNTYTLAERDAALSVLSDANAPYEARMQAAQFLQDIREEENRPKDLLALQKQAEAQYIDTSAEEIADLMRKDRQPVTTIDPEPYMPTGITKADIEAAFNEPVGTVGDKTITAWDVYRQQRPDVFPNYKGLARTEPVAQQQQQLSNSDIAVDSELYTPTDTTKTDTEAAFNAPVAPITPDYRKFDLFGNPLQKPVTPVESKQDIEETLQQVKLEFDRAGKQIQDLQQALKATLNDDGTVKPRLVTRHEKLKRQIKTFTSLQDKLRKFAEKRFNTAIEDIPSPLRYKNMAPVERGVPRQVEIYTKPRTAGKPITYSAAAEEMIEADIPPRNDMPGVIYQNAMNEGVRDTTGDKPKMSSEEADIARTEAFDIQQAKFSRKEPQTGDVISAFTPAKSQKYANWINAGLVDYFGESEWYGAFTQVEMPSHLKPLAEAVKAVFGADVVLITPNDPKFDIFHGVFYSGVVYVNTASDKGFMNIVGHEIYHKLKKQRPDLHAWFVSHARRYYKNFDQYTAKLNKGLAENEAKHTRQSAEIELSADFTGDSLADPEFLMQLAKDNPSKFSKLLNVVTNWLKTVMNKLAGANLGASQYFTETSQLRNYLKTVLTEFANDPNNAIDKVQPPAFSRVITEKQAEQAKALANSFKVEAGDKWDKIKPYVLTLHQLVDQFKDKIASLPLYAKTIDRMEQVQQQLAMLAHPIIINWQALNSDVRDKLHNVMRDATRLGIHPDKSFDDPLNKHLTEKDRGEYERLRSAYALLPENAKRIYHQSKELLSKFWQMRGDFYTELVNYTYGKLIAKQPENRAALEKKRDALIAEHKRNLATIKGPYFPLLRFGDYIVVAKSEAYIAKESELATLSGEKLRIAQAELEQMKRDPKHYSSWATESKTLALQKAEELRANKLIVAEPRLAEEHSFALSPISNYGLQRINEMLNAEFDKTTSDKIERMLTEFYFVSLPEHHALQRQIKRIGVEGAEINMLRSFARAVQADSFYLSRMKYRNELDDLLFKMKGEAKAAGIDAQHVFNAIQRNLDLDMQFKPHPIVSALQKVSSFVHLGLSPAYLFTNGTQPWMITLPQMAGDYGFFPTLKALSAAWNDAKNTIVASKKKGAFAEITFDSIKNADERAALEYIRDLGQIDITINFDIGNTAEATSPRLLKFQQVTAWANHHIEVSNRIATALAAYRLARKNGLPHEQAMEYAYKQVIDTQLDYSNANTAYFMKHQHFNGLNALVMQFRKYQQGMVYLLLNNAKKAFHGDRHALASLGYLMTMQVAFAGITGVPITFPLLFLLSLGSDDDDERGDMETRFRNMLTDAFGKSTATALYNGLPTLLGMDLSKRLGMGDLLDPLPFYDLKEMAREKTGKDVIGKTLLAAAGPAAGMVANWIDAVHRFEDGQWNRGFEKVLPKAFADVFKAYRYANEGITTLTGNVAVDKEKLSTWDLIQRLTGFTPSVESTYYEATNAKEATVQAIMDRRQKLITSYATYKMQGNEEAVANMETAIKNWNAKHPQKGVRIDRSTLIKSVKQRKKLATERDAAGVRFKKNEAYMKDITRFATG